MKLVVLASLVFALPAAADATFAKPPGAHVKPAPGCRAAGTPLFEIRARSEIKQPTSTVSIYSTGAWTFQPVDADGVAGTATTGCLDRGELATIRKTLQAMPWQVTYSRIVCFAYSPQFTELVVHGKVQFRQQMCSGAMLDDASRQALAKIDALLSPVLPRERAPASATF